MDETDRQTTDRLEAIFESAVDGIIVIDEHGVVESVNQAAVDIFGYAREEMVGDTVNQLMPSPYRDEHDAYLERYRRTGERRIIGIGREVEARRKEIQRKAAWENVRPSAS